MYVCMYMYIHKIRNIERIAYFICLYVVYVYEYMCKITISLSQYRTIIQVPEHIYKFRNLNIRLQPIPTIFLPDEKKMREIWTKAFFSFFEIFFCPFSRNCFFGGKEDRELMAVILIFDFLLLWRMNNFWIKNLDKKQTFRKLLFLG